MKRLEDFLVRFYPAGTYTWVVPDGCTEVDVFLVGGGGGANHNNTYGTPAGGGGGYTKTFKGKGYVKPSSGTWVESETGGRDGDAIPVVPGQQIQIIVGAGISGNNGGFSQFMNSNYRAEGGRLSQWNGTGNGGSGGVSVNRSTHSVGGSDGSGHKGYGSSSNNTSGQNHTTRDFGEFSGKRNAGGGASSYNKAGGETSLPGPSDYTEGSGEGSNESSSVASGWSAGLGGGGYGGGAGGNASKKNTKGGDGTVLIRGKRFKQ